MEARTTNIHWHPHPGGTLRRYDVLYCAFPMHGAPLSPAGVLHPAVIIDFELDRKRSCWMTKAAPATTEIEGDRWLGRHLILTKTDDLKRAKLRVPTRFDLGNIRVIPWTIEFFPKPEWGYLSKIAIADLNALLKKHSKR